jgi:uncharacterized protein YutD
MNTNVINEKMPWYLRIPNSWVSKGFKNEIVEVQKCERFSDCVFFFLSESLYESEEVIVKESYVKRYIAVHTKDNQFLKGWLYSPKTVKGKHSVVGMNETLIKKANRCIDEFLAGFCQVGFSVFLYENIQEQKNGSEICASEDADCLYPYYW